jgi:hypothetical protein
MWRALLALALLTVAGATVGSAASISVTTGAVGAAMVVVPRCTTTGLLVVNNLSGSNVASVTVSSIPAGCAAATIQAAVNNGTTSGSGSATVPAGGGTVTVSLSSTPAATTNIQTEILFTGP